MNYEPKVQVDQKYAMKASEAYLDFYTGTVVVEGVMYGSLVPSDWMEPYLDAEVSEHYTQLENDTIVGELTQGVWVAYNDPTGVQYVPEYLFLQHATLVEA